MTTLAELGVSVGSRYRGPAMGTLICTIELNKKTGTTVTVKDEEGKLTQSITMDGKSITVKMIKDDDGKFSSIKMDQKEIVSTVKGDETSTITQVHDTITVKVKNFIVDAETVKVTSKKTSDYEAKDAMTVKAAKAMSVSTDDALTVKSAKDTSVTASGAMNLKATKDITAEGQNVAIKGQMAVKIQGAQKVDVKGAQVSIKGDAQVEVAAPATNLGQTMTTVKGSMVKIEGAMVKVG